MYHKGNLFQKGYYDTIEEIPNTAIVRIYGQKDKTLTLDELYSLAEEGKWYFVEHTCNWGCCDHWDSQPLRKWIEKYFLEIVRYTNPEGKTLGYNRVKNFVILCENKYVSKSEVWNS